MANNEYLNNKTFELIIKEFQFYKRKKFRSEFIVNDFKETNDLRQLKYNDDLKKDILLEKEESKIQTIHKYEEYQSQLAYAFYILSENIANYAKFTGIDIDDAIQEGVLICFEKIDRFDPRKGKAFNYMTTCILNHYRQLYRSARNYNELKKRYHTFLSDKFDKIVIRNGKERHNSKSNIDKINNIW